MKSSGMGTTSPMVVVLAMLVVALLLAGTTAARPFNGDNTDTIIRLPNIGGAGGGAPWPWGKCCDFIFRMPNTTAPTWRCFAVAAECPASCLECEHEWNGLMCADVVVSPVEPPTCTPRPWDCCDLGVCTGLNDCICLDLFESCPMNCKECVMEQSDPPRYRCLNSFHGSTGPTCTPMIN